MPPPNELKYACYYYPVSDHNRLNHHPTPLRAVSEAPLIGDYIKSPDNRSLPSVKNCTQEVTAALRGKSAVIAGQFGTRRQITSRVIVRLRVRHQVRHIGMIHVSGQVEIDDQLPCFHRSVSVFAQERMHRRRQGTKLRLLERLIKQRVKFPDFGPLRYRLNTKEPNSMNVRFAYLGLDQQHKTPPSHDWLHIYSADSLRPVSTISNTYVELPAASLYGNTTATAFY